ncbi:MAG: hypothetical protein RBU29_08600 [bacterium]|jgi:hypothetical protein|nr:hypothetical protein [bacterium]
MYPIPGHLALSLGGSYLAGLPYIPAIAATFFVDVADKFAIDIFHIAPYGRCWFHTLLSVVVCSAIVWKIKGKEWGLSWALGHFLHLIGDVGFIPWFYPFLDYTWPDAPNMVAVTVEGAKETLQGFQVVQNESGDMELAGWHFSDAVRKVFIPRLMLLELGMLFPIAALVYFKEMALKYKIPLYTLSGLCWLWSTLYQFNGSMNYIAPLLGNWVYL